MIPTRFLYIILWGWGIFGAIAGLLPDYQTAWWIAGLVIFLAMVVEFFRLYGWSWIKCTRIVQPALALGSWSPVELILRNTGNRKLKIEVFDHYPVQAEIANMPVQCVLAEKSEVKINYRILPVHRGEFTFPKVQLRIQGPWNLFIKDKKLHVRSVVRVYPNFTNVVKYSMLTHEQRQSQMGIRRRRRRGEGLDFRQLREFRMGDSLRQVDWNASSRMSKLISKEYQDERDQRVIFLLDCSRRMLAKDGELNHFDHTLNAVLLLSYVASRQGDAVGILSFSGDERWLAPRKGAVAVNGILDKIYDLQPSFQSADYHGSAQKLMSLLNKRSFVIFITNIRDEDSDELLPALKILKRRHLVLLASMRESILDTTLKQPVQGFQRALEQAAVHKYLEYRNKLTDRIREQNILTLDVVPNELPVSMVNSYFQVKSAGLL